MPSFPDAVAFGRALLASDDLDPVYTMLARVPRPQRRRVCFHYWCLYDMGLAATLGASPGWDGLRRVVASPGGARGAERRHFRGVAAQRAVAHYAERFATPEHAVAFLTEQPSFVAVVGAARTLPLFGPWISFKVADMAVQLFDVPLGAEDSVFPLFYDEPRRGAALAAPGLGHDATTPLPVLSAALLAALGEGAPNWAPSRALGLLEAETIFCKWKTHTTSRYHVGQDRAHLVHVLGRAEGPLVRALAAAL